MVALPALKVNGKRTLAENIADSGGLRIAFRALVGALAAQGKADDDKIDGYTESQRFFLSFAQLWCQNQTSRSARQSVSADPHSPGRWRVNDTVQNFEEFGNAFECLNVPKAGPCTLRNPAGFGNLTVLWSRVIYSPVGICFAVDNSTGEVWLKCE